MLKVTTPDRSDRRKRGKDDTLDACNARMREAGRACPSTVHFSGQFASASFCDEIGRSFVGSSTEEVVPGRIELDHQIGEADSVAIFECV